MVLAQLLIVALVLLLSIWYWRNRRLIKTSWKVPGPFALPPIGTIFYLPKLFQLEDILYTLLEAGRNFPNRIKFWLGPYFILVLKDPEEIKCFFLNKSSSTKSFIFSKWKEIMGHGIVTSSGDFWKFHRRIANPYFNGLLLKNYQDIYVKNSKHLVNSFEKFCDKEPVDVVLFANRYTGDILAEAIFKLEPHFYTGNYDKFIFAIDDVALTSFQRMAQIWLHPKWIFNMTKLGEKANKAIAMNRKYGEFIINENEKRLNTIQDEDDLGFVGTLLQNLKDENGVQNMEEVLNQLENMFPAGMDTSGTIAAFFVLSIAMQKRCQDILWNEIKEVCGEEFQKDVELSDLSRMPYLDWCMKEVCRLFPVGFITLRDIDSDIHMKTSHSDYVIPHGTTVMVSNFLVHRDESLWDNPEEFIPERFSPEMSKGRQPYSFLPFGGGSRICLGQKFGNDSLKTMMVYILQRFELHSDWKLKDIPLKADISTRSRWGYKVRFTRRKHTVSAESSDKK